MRALPHLSRFGLNSLTPVVLGIALVASLTGGAVSMPAGRSGSPSATASPQSAVGALGGAVETETAPGGTTALALLATLPIKGRAPMTGYQRTVKFGAAWVDLDNNGCDTRNDVLGRDLTAVVKSGRCRVVSGLLTSPYTGKIVSFVRGARTSTAVQIDHVVSLGDAWRTGAQQLSQAKRVSLANDPANLLAVDGRSNEQKGDGDAATWLPSFKTFRCAYVTRQISVKASYGLWVTRAERDAMLRVLSKCVDASSVAVPAAPALPAPSPGLGFDISGTGSVPPANTARSAVRPGAFCSTAGERGATSTGRAMACVRTATDSRLRWRSG
ncbi:MAG: HNH endonuclease family protein [Actinomycetota bacterium]